MVTVRLTRSQALLLAECFHVADRVLDLGKILGHRGRLNSARTAVKKIRPALEAPPQ